MTWEKASKAFWSSDLRTFPPTDAYIIACRPGCCGHTRFCFHPVSRLNRCAQESQSDEADGHTEREDLTCELHVERRRRTGRHLSPAAVSGAAGSSSTFPAFPEIGTVQDSRNFRNEPGGVGGVETGWDIKVSVVEWCYQRTLFLGLHAGGKKREGRQAEFCTFIQFPQFEKMILFIFSLS